MMDRKGYRRKVETIANENIWNGFYRPTFCKCLSQESYKQ